MTIAISRAASVISFFCEALKPVVPITRPAPCRRHAARFASVPSGRVKSTSTPPRTAAFAGSSPIFTPQGAPTSSPASFPTSGPPFISRAAASLRSLERTTASIRARPMRPDAPAIAIFNVAMCPPSHLFLRRGGRSRGRRGCAGRRRYRRPAPAALRHHVAFEARQLVVLEHHHDPAPLHDFALLHEQVDVVPAILAKRIHHERRPEREAHLGAAHARLKLGDHVLRHDIPLLDFRPVRREQIAGGQEQRSDNDAACVPDGSAPPDCGGRAREKSWSV